MWIRSQDGWELMFVRGVGINKRENNYRVITFNPRGIDDGWVLGWYETEAEAKAVLDDIQNVLMCTEGTIVYEMPEKGWTSGDSTGWENVVAGGLID